MKIIVTGGCGFIGSNLIIHLLENKPEWEIYNIDALTYAADLNNLNEIKGNLSYNFLELDINDKVKLKKIFSDINPDGVFHLAAESHVDNSISNPSKFIDTNIFGTYNLLESSREIWGTDFSKRFLHVSTDEVYGDLKTDENPFTEESRYKPSSPYSASKAASDHLVRAWARTYNMNVVLSNCSNNFGPKQHKEKLIPTVINSCLNNLPIPIYGKGENIRDWLFVEDHCSALLSIFEKGKSFETYLIGTRNELQNIELIKIICKLMDEILNKSINDSCLNLISFVKDRAGHDMRYAVDPSKIESALNWKPNKNFKTGLSETIDWYLDKFNNTSK